MIREPAAVAAAALGLDGGEIDKSALTLGSRVAGLKAYEFDGRIFGLAASPTAAAPEDDDQVLRFMVYQSMQQHAAVARSQIAMQLEADQPSPDPSTLPIPSFLIPSLPPLGAELTPAPGSSSMPSSVQRRTPAPGQSTPTAAPRGTTSLYRTRSAL